MENKLPWKLWSLALVGLNAMLVPAECTGKVCRVEWDPVVSLDW